jgi:hypothetical protein
VTYFNNPQSYNSTQFGTFGSFWSPFVWYKFQDTGSVINWSTGSDGYCWYLLTSITKANFVGAGGAYNWLAIMIDLQNSSNGTIYSNHRMTFP